MTSQTGHFNQQSADRDAGCTDGRQSLLPVNGPATYFEKDNLLLIFLLAAAYFVSGMLSFSIFVSYEIITLVIFFAEGISLAFILLYGHRVWPGIFIGQLSLALYNGLDLPASAGIALVNSTEALLALFIFRKLKLDKNLASLKDYFGLLLLIFLVLQPYSASAGITVLWLTQHLSGGDFFNGWFSWWMGNSLGQLLVAPMLMHLARVQFRFDQKVIMLLSVIVLASLLYVFVIDSKNFALFYSVYTPLFIIAGVFLRLGFISLGLILITIIFLVGGRYGYGPFDSNNTVFLVNLNVSLLGLIITSQLIAKLFHERSIDRNKLTDAYEELNNVLAERTRRLNSMHRAIIDNSAVAIITVSLDGKITLFNRAAEDLLGYQASQLIGRESPAIFHLPEEISCYAKTLSEEFNTVVEANFDVFITRARLGLADKSEWTYVRKDGTHVPVLLSISPLRSTEGEEITGYMGIATDISELKQTAEKLQNKEKEIENVFYATVHSTQHILNNLLNQLALIELEIKRHPDFSEKVIEQFFTMKNQAKQLVIQLSSVKEITAAKIKESVYPK